MPDALMSINSNMSNEIRLSTPTKAQGGSYLSKCYFKQDDEYNPVYIQTPPFIFSGVKIKKNMMYVEIEETKKTAYLFDLISKIENNVVQLILSNSKKWFKQQFTSDLLLEFFKSRIKILNDKKIIEIKIPSKNNEIDLDIIDEDCNTINIVDIENKNVCAIFTIDTCKFLKNSSYLDLTIIKLQYQKDKLIDLIDVSEPSENVIVSNNYDKINFITDKDEDKDEDNDEHEETTVMHPPQIKTLEELTTQRMNEEIEQHNEQQFIQKTLDEEIEQVEQQEQVDAQQEQVEVQQEKVDIQQEHIDAQQEHVEVQQEHIDAQQEHVEVQQEHIDAQQEHVEVQQEHVEVQQEHIDAQQEHIDAQQEHVDAQQDHVEVQQDHVEVQQEQQGQDLERYVEQEQVEQEQADTHQNIDKNEKNVKVKNTKEDNEMNDDNDNDNEYDSTEVMKMIEEMPLDDEIDAIDLNELSHVKEIDLQKYYREHEHRNNIESSNTKEEESIKKELYAQKLEELNDLERKVLNDERQLLELRKQYENHNSRIKKEKIKLNRLKNKVNKDKRELFQEQN
jgi:hypothetical protein